MAAAAQQSFTDMEYQGRKRKTRREEFLECMEECIPWDEWVEYILPHYFKGKRGRPPRGIETMLRMYLLQCWFNLSDEAVEDSIYDSYAMRRFMKLNFMTEQTPDATTLCKFRKIMVDNKIQDVFFQAINRKLSEYGRIMRGGTIVDATIIDSTRSTKNATGERDPEMHQTKKGNQWYHGMKLHIGVDAGTGYVHTASVTPANEHDVTQTVNLIREDDEVVYGDSGYQGAEKREEIKADPDKSKVEFRISKRYGSRKKMGYIQRGWERKIEGRKSSVRSKVEHIFLLVKNQFGYRKTVYRGLEKNRCRLMMLLCSSNLLMHMRSGGQRIELSTVE
jgi:IS5 family transposase